MKMLSSCHRFPEDSNCVTDKLDKCWLSWRCDSIFHSFWAHFGVSCMKDREHEWILLFRDVKCRSLLHTLNKGMNTILILGFRGFILDFFLNASVNDLRYKFKEFENMNLVQNIYFYQIFFDPGLIIYKHSVLYLDKCSLTNNTSCSHQIGPGLILTKFLTTPDLEYLRSFKLIGFLAMEEAFVHYINPVLLCIVFYKTSSYVFFPDGKTQLRNTKFNFVSNHGHLLII